MKTSKKRSDEPKNYPKCHLNGGAHFFLFTQIIYFSMASPPNNKQVQTATKRPKLSTKPPKPKHSYLL
jgi:hypothetical protein